MRKLETPSITIILFSNALWKEWTSISTEQIAFTEKHYLSVEHNVTSDETFRATFKAANKFAAPELVQYTVSLIV